MSNTKYICATSDFAELKKIRDFVKMKSKDFGIPPYLIDKMVLAVDEACTNIIKHSFNEDITKELCIEIDKEKDNFFVSIYDNGKPFDPNNVNSPNMDNYFKEFKKSGLGIYLIRSLIDEIQYIPANTKNKHNLLKLIKKIT